MWSFRTIKGFRKKTFKLTSFITNLDLNPRGVTLQIQATHIGLGIGYGENLIFCVFVSNHPE